MNVFNLIDEHVPACAEMMCGVYNNEMWQCHWDLETASEYLMDLVESNKFVGFVVEDQNEIVGAMFCKEKIWWNASELYIEEMFVTPKLQRQGIGTMLIQEAEKYAVEHSLAGFTLNTNRFAPAPKFYEKNGFQTNEAVILMYKECSRGA